MVVLTTVLWIVLPVHGVSLNDIIKHVTKSRKTVSTSKKHRQATKVILDPVPDPLKLSSLVVFSTEKPKETPYSSRQSDMLPNVLNYTRYSTFNAASFPIRNKRQIDDVDFDHIAQPVCERRHDWLQKTEAINSYHHKVSVLQKINVAGVLVNQYFFETWCREEESKCTGIDRKSFKSFCQTKFIWAYAMVRNDNNEEGWSHIKLRGSCNCAVIAIKPTSRVSLLGYL